MKDIRAIVRLYQSRPNESFALATLVRATGSSYRRPGARMLIAQDGTTAGSLSAGCLEDEVAVAAIDVIKTGEPRLMAFDTRRRFGCNGSIDIFVERVSTDWLRDIAENVEARRSFTITTRQFVQEIEPQIRLLIVGAGPDAVALCSQAQLLGWETLALESIADWSGEFDARTAAVIATHNYGRDCAALRHLLPLGLRYVGLIGPRRRRDELLIDVLDSGADLKSQLFAPAGLDVGAETPAEIALAIVTEIQNVFAGGTGASLRDSKLPIHGRQAPCLSRPTGFQPVDA
jgi:xanthine/CO dehydrogenase XdhC/CoxF family maturation factor